MAVKILFEDALDMTGFGKFNIMVLFLNISVIMGMTFEIVSVAYLVPASACELGTTSFQQGLMAGMPLVGIISTSHFWGYLADTRGRKKILCLSMTLGFVAGSLASLSPNWIVFSFFKFMSSSAVAGTYALTITLIAECTPGRRRSTMIVLTGAIYEVATGIMALLTIPILSMSFSYYIPLLNIYFNSWRLLNMVFAVPCAIGALGVVFAFESPKYLLSVGRDTQALEVLRAIFVINTGKPREDYQVNALTLDEASNTQVKGLWASIVSQTVPLFKPPLLNKAILISILYMIIYFCHNSIVVWVPFIIDAVMRSLEGGDTDFTFCQMIQSSQNVTMTQTSDCSLNQFAMIIVFALNLILAALNAGLSTFINYIGKKRLFIVIQVMSGLAGLLINLSSKWIISGLLFFVFVSGVINYGFLATFSIDIFPTYVKAMALCLTLMLGRGISVLGINILKTTLQDNCDAAFYLFGGLTLLGGFIAFLLPTDVKLPKTKATCSKTKVINNCDE